MTALVSKIKLTMVKVYTQVETEYLFKVIRVVEILIRYLNVT